MKVDVETPESYQGTIVGDITSRRGIITATSARGDRVVMIECEVPLAETFGYATDLRGMSKGEATFSMELACYRKVPASIQKKLIEEQKEAQLVGAK